MKIKVIKKILCVILVLTVAFTFTGCWNYRGLNEISIVAGIALDVNSENDHYILSVEIIDLTKSSKTTGVISKVIESEGITIFDAIRNAKMKLINKLYFGNAQVLVLSQEVVRKIGVDEALNMMLRGVEPRETIDLVISQEKTAKELLTAKGEDDPVVSFAMRYIIDEDHLVTSSVSDIKLYQAYNILHCESKAGLVLPVFHKAVKKEEPSTGSDSGSAEGKGTGQESSGQGGATGSSEREDKSVSEGVIEANGSAAFKGETLVGFLTPSESKNYLFVIDEVTGGILAYDDIGDNIQRISLEIYQSKTNVDYTYSNNKLKMKVDISLRASLSEVMGNFDVEDSHTIQQLEQITASRLSQSVAGTIEKVQKEFDADIFRFGKTIHEKNSKLWKQLEGDWENTFRNLEVEINTKITIRNTGLINKS